ASALARVAYSAAKLISEKRGRQAHAKSWVPSNGKCVFDVARPGRGCGEHHVEGDVVAGVSRMTDEPILRGPHDPPLLPGGDGPGGIIARLAPFHLDEGEPPALER